jgi:glycine/D-amino acid oxidase-like deaminating enzyme
VHGALFDPRAGTIQPRAYAVGLARAATAAGARIVQGARATGVLYRDDLWQMQVGGHRVTADALIEGTNAYGSARDRYTKMAFFQMATDPLPPALLDGILPGGEGCWDTALVMTSFRRDAAGRVIIGSVGSLDHAGSGLHRAWARRKMESLYPQLKGVALAHEWYGTIATTGDHLPRVLRLGPRGYAVFGYSGRGIGTGTLFGRALAGAVVSGQENGLPVTPVDSYSEGFTGAKAAYYETGALAAHGAGLLRGR